jgi:hypothetical protein
VALSGEVRIVCCVTSAVGAEFVVGDLPDRRHPAADIALNTAALTLQTDLTHRDRDLRQRQNCDNDSSDTQPRRMKRARKPEDGHGRGQTGEQHTLTAGPRP